MKTPRLPTRAVLYVRVSTTGQVTDGSGQQSQEYRCRQRAEELGLDVAAVFYDDKSGVGDFMKRPGMLETLAFLDAHKGEPFVVIFDDLNRFSRDPEFGNKLKREFIGRGAVLECLNFQFEDTPENEFILTLLIAAGKLEAEQNRRQVIQKMHARVEQGFWISRQPIGYRFVRSKRGGKELVVDPIVGPVVREALKGFANGTFQTQTEVQRFLNDHPDFPQHIYRTGVRRLLTQVKYTGYIDLPKWNIKLVKGQHEPLITWQEYQQIQKRLDGGGHAPARKDLNQDFVLRGIAECNDCGYPLTACYSKSKDWQAPSILPLPSSGMCRLRQVDPQG